MEKITISLEATCDMPESLLTKYNLDVIDMEYRVGEEEYTTAKDDVVSSGLYQKMRHGAKTMTSQINETLYEEFFTHLLSRGQDVLHLGFSSGLSGTVHKAKAVADKLNETSKNKVYVIDTLCACSGQGYIAMLARQYCDEGHTIQEVIQYVEGIKLYITHGFTVDNLKYLASGGRLKASSAFIGNLLNIKPVMRTDEAGRLTVYKKVLSRKKAIMALVDTMKETIADDCKICFISHADCMNDALNMKELITSIRPDIEVVVTNLGPVIGAHSGPGTLSIYYVSKVAR